MRNETDCIVARCKGCEGLVFASKPDKDAEKEVGKLAIAGFQIETMHVEDVRKSKFGCECKKEKPVIKAKPQPQMELI